MIIDATTIQELLVTFAWLTPILVALVRVIRVTFKVADRYVPGVSVLVGIAGGLLFVGLTPLGAAVGVILGLTASGLYDVGKKTVLGA